MGADEGVPIDATRAGWEVLLLSKKPGDGTGVDGEFRSAPRMNGCCIKSECFAEREDCPSRSAPVPAPGCAS